MPLLCLHSVCGHCKQLARGPATQVALGPPLLQKYHIILFYFPLFQWASASQLLLLFLKQTLTHEGAINAGRAPIAHVFGRDAGPGAVPIPLAGPCSPLSPAALPCPFVEIYRAEWAENK